MTAAPGNRELTTGELPSLVGGELPAVLPLEGWTTITLHGQLDRVGPSSRHPDLAEIVVSIPRRPRCRSGLANAARASAAYGLPGSPARASP